MTCTCLTEHPQNQSQHIADVYDLAEEYDDGWFSECSKCKRHWLRVLFEAPHQPKAGHWYDAALPTNFDHRNFIGSKENIEVVFAKAEAKFRGGSFLDGKVEAFQGLPKRLV